MGHQIKEYINNDELLQFALENDMLNLSYVQEAIAMKKREEILKKHTYEIWKGENGYYYTYIKNGSKRKLIKKINKSGIEDAIVNAYQEEENNPTIKEIFDEWNQRRVDRKKIQQSTHLRDQNTFRRHYKEFGERRIKSVSKEEFVDFLEEQIPKFDLTAKAFCNLKSITRGFLKYAKRQKLINFQVDEIFMELDTSERDFKKNIKEDYEEVFDEDEMPIMIEYLENHADIVNLGILLMFTTGMRVGELCSLKWEDCCGNTIKIRRSETFYKDQTTNEMIYKVRDYPKTDAGIRDVVLPPSYEWIMTYLKKENPFTEYVFTRDGKRLRAYTFRNRLYSVCKQTKCYQKSPHKIRKTYGTILLDNNIDSRMIIGQMGHTDILCTEKHYHRNRKSIDTKSDILSKVPEFKGQKNNQTYERTHV